MITYRSLILIVIPLRDNSNTRRGRGGSFQGESIRNVGKSISDTRRARLIEIRTVRDDTLRLYIVLGHFRFFIEVDVVHRGVSIIYVSP